MTYRRSSPLIDRLKSFFMTLIKLISTYIVGFLLFLAEYFWRHPLVQLSPDPTEPRP